jgi:Ca-activated chloride channel family protein
MENNLIQLQLNTDLALIAREIPTQRVLEMIVQAPTAETKSTSRPPLNLALVLDRSGSMSGRKLDYVKQAAIHLVDMLQEQDRVALVTFDNNVDVISQSCRVTKKNRRDLQDQISRIESGGSTNLSGGWLAGCEEVARHQNAGMLNRTLLLTDGLANVGITDMELLAQQAGELSHRGISTSTFGVGLDFNEHLLEGMANQSEGNYYFIDSPEKAHEFFLQEIGQIMKINLREVEIILDLSQNVVLNVLGGWKNWRADNHLHIYIGSLYSQQIQRIYVLLKTPADGKSNDIIIKALVLGKDNSGHVYEFNAKLVYQYTDAVSVKNGQINLDVMGRFATVYLAETTNEALKIERMGKNEEASQHLNQAIYEYGIYLDPMERERYLQMAERMKHGMLEIDRKSSQFLSYSIRRSKDARER